MSINSTKFWKEQQRLIEDTIFYHVAFYQRLRLASRDRARGLIIEAFGKSYRNLDLQIHKDEIELKVSEICENIRINNTIT